MLRGIRDQNTVAKITLGLYYTPCFKAENDDVEGLLDNLMAQVLVNVAMFQFTHYLAKIVCMRLGK